MGLVEDLGIIERITREVTAQEAEAADKEARWPERTIRSLQRAGLGGFVLSPEHGGRGHGLYGLTRVCEALGRESASAAICFGMHCVGSAVLGAKATQTQIQKYLKPICAGEHLTTLSLSEPGTGIHFYYPQTQLRPGKDGKLVVNGAKTLATNGGYADSYVVSTTSLDPKAPAGMFSCVIVGRDAPGLEWGPEFAGLGLRGNSSRGFTLRDVVLPAEDLLGEDGDQIWYIFHVVAPFFLVAMAGTYIGVAERALSLATGRFGARDYVHSGRSSVDEPVVQHRFGTLWANVERTRRLAYWAAREADEGGPSALPALCSAKAEAGDCAVQVVNEAMTLAGGRAYREGSELDRLLRDARAAHVMSPTTDILRTWTGRAILGKPLLSD